MDHARHDCAEGGHDRHPQSQQRPGSAQDANYVAAIAQIHAAGGKVIGYVSSAYATRSLSAVVQDISTYLSFYSVDGFFIDEMTSDSDTTHIQYYQSVYNYIKGLSSAYAVTGNPGTGIPELYASLPVADQFVVFENSAAQYASYAPQAWQASYPTSRFAHIVYGAASGGGCCRLSRARRPWGRQCVRHAQELAGPVLGIAQILEPGNRGRRRELTLGPAGRSERAGRQGCLRAE